MSFTLNANIYSNIYEQQIECFECFVLYVRDHTELRSLVKGKFPFVYFMETWLYIPMHI